jgi:hypothetical protein
MSHRMMLNKNFRLGRVATHMQDLIVILTQITSIREQIGDRITITDLPASSIFLS